MEEKKCTKCGEVKALSEFYKRKGAKIGFTSACKKCELLRCKKYCADNNEKHRLACKNWEIKHLEQRKEAHKTWKINNLDRVKATVKRSRDKHPETHKRILSNWQKRNREKLNAMARKWARENPDKVKVHSKRKYLKKISTSGGRLNHNIKSLIRYSLRGSKDGLHWENLVGYSLSDLKAHIERQFNNGMSWERYLNGEIHIDHRTPLSAFNFSSPNDLDFRKAWALSNLRPLWAKDNLKKGARLERPFQPSLAIAVNY